MHAMRKLVLLPLGSACFGQVMRLNAIIDFILKNIYHFRQGSDAANENEGNRVMLTTIKRVEPWELQEGEGSGFEVR